MSKDISKDMVSDSVGLGVDIVDIDRIKKAIDKTPNFLEFTYTDNEIQYCKSSTRWAEHFSTHFAAKEAVLKALGNGFADGIGPKDVEVVHNKKGKPYIVLRGAAKKVADEKGVLSIPISLSFTKSEAVGFAIALTDKSHKESDILNKAKDPMALLAKQFKEAKTILENDNIYNNSSEKAINKENINSNEEN